MFSCPSISDSALHVCHLLKDLSEAHWREKRSDSLRSVSSLDMFLQFRNFARIVTYPIYFNSFFHTVKCSLSRITLAQRRSNNSVQCSRATSQPLAPAFQKQKKPFKMLFFLQVRGTFQFLKQYFSTPSTSCSNYFGVL